MDLDLDRLEKIRLQPRCSLKTRDIDEVLSALPLLLARVREAEKLAQLLEQAIPPEGIREWWCPACKREVPGIEVTYLEYHETCGTHLTQCNTDSWVEKARQALAEWEGKKDGNR